MKKLSLYVFLVLMFCNTGFAECIEGDCNNGYGTYTWADGDKYVGEHKAGKEHGQGTYTYANGDQYIGEYKDGEIHGQGIFTFANGDEYVGEFKDGKLIELKEELMKKYDAYQSLEMKMKVSPSGFDFACYNACKERNDEAFCRQKCSMQ